jgi:hypothetical protein
MQRFANESYRHVWGYWGQVYDSFSVEKDELGWRVERVAELNSVDELLAFGELLDERLGAPAMSEVPSYTAPAIAN